jgi:hypothetical protein
MSGGTPLVATIAAAATAIVNLRIAFSLSRRCFVLLTTLTGGCFHQEVARGKPFTVWAGTSRSEQPFRKLRFAAG